MNRELSFDRKAHRDKRLAFVRDYADWVIRTSNPNWSKVQAALIDIFVVNTRNMPLSRRTYLKKVLVRRDLNVVSIPSLLQLGI